MRVAILTGFVFTLSGWAQRSPIADARLFVDVRPEAVLAWQGDSVVLVKLRIAPGAQARVWADESCGSPGTPAQALSASGIYTISLADIGGTAKPLVCLSSSDGTINANLPAPHP